MESNSFRKLLLIFAIILAVPVMSSLYGAIPTIITALLALAAIIIVFLFFATRTESRAVSKGISRDIRSINIRVCGRSYIISEGESFNTEDNEQPGILSFIENGVWNICDNPEQTIKGAVAQITVPKGFVLDKLNIAVQEGNILINSISAKASKINVMKDFAQIKSLNTSALCASVGKGQLLINTALGGNAVLSCGSGALDVTIDAGAEDYNIEATTGAGTVSLNGDVLLDSTNRSEKIDNGANRTIKASCGLGQLAINFTEVAIDDEN